MSITNLNFANTTDHYLQHMHKYSRNTQNKRKVLWQLLFNVLRILTNKRNYKFLTSVLFGP